MAPSLVNHRTDRTSATGLAEQHSSTATTAAPAVTGSTSSHTNPVVAHGTIDPHHTISTATRPHMVAVLRVGVHIGRM
jgi:hypothetical protein